MKETITYRPLPIEIINVTQINTIKDKSKLKVPDKDTSFKAYMDYRTITDKTSDQWKLQQQAKTDKNGLRKIDDYYCVAMGFYYADSCGKKFKVTLDSGTEFNVIVSDLKMPKHTNKTNMYTPMKNGDANLLEFIVDTRKLPQLAKDLGSVSCLSLEGNVVSIEEIED